MCYSPTRDKSLMTWENVLADRNEPLDPILEQSEEEASVTNESTALPNGSSRRERREMLENNASIAAEKDEGHLGAESPKIVHDASKIGEQRLVRPPMGHAITSFAGGMSVSFGAVAMVNAAASVGGTMKEPSLGLLIGALFFPIGFVILLIGKTELFTENFLVPVVAVIKRRGSIGQLMKLWSIAFTFNLLGALLFAFLISREGVYPHSAANEMIYIAEKKIGYDFGTAFVKAIFAGWLMTTLTWLIIAAKGMGAQLAFMWIIGTLIVLGQFNHVVISASEIFMGMFLGADVSVQDWIVKNVIPAMAGNLVGGIFFVTIIHYWQSLYHTPIADNEQLDEAIEI